MYTKFSYYIKFSIFKSALISQLLFSIIQTEAYSSFIVLLTHKYSKNRHKSKHFVTFHNTEVWLQGFEKVKP